MKKGLESAVLLMIGAIVLVVIALINKRPIPGQLKTLSTIIDPESKEPN